NETALGAFANQDYPFDLVVQDIRRERGTDTPFHSIVFVLQNASKESLTFDDITLRTSLSDRLLEDGDPIAEGFGDDLTVQYDLHIEAWEMDEQINIMVQYNPTRFRAETVDGFLVQLLAVFEQFVAESDLRLSQFEVFDPFELNDLFEEDEGKSL
ncbi:MAG: hypothetical protein JOZ18_16365, partial [Chloroflexi bacterium]|nr:hypothetical protein [Chloroflexota bacterium]